MCVCDVCLYMCLYECVHVCIQVRERIEPEIIVRCLLQFFSSLFFESESFTET